MTRWILGGLVVMATAAHAGEPAIGPEPPAPLPPAPLAPAPAVADGPWALELIVSAMPEQPQDIQCSRNGDCMTPAKAWFGGALRGRYLVPERLSIAATLGLANLVDQEERPPSYTALSLRVDAQIELGRGPDRFGAALRASQVLMLAWAETGTAVRTDFPGVALVLGTSELWGEVGVRTFPTPYDPRGFHLAFGFVLDRWSGTAGVATFATLGFKRDEVDIGGTSPGAYGDVTVRITDRFDLRLFAIISAPVILNMGFGWRFPP